MVLDPLGQDDGPVQLGRQPRAERGPARALRGPLPRRSQERDARCHGAQASAGVPPATAASMACCSSGDSSMDDWPPTTCFTYTRAWSRWRIDEKTMPERCWSSMAKELDCCPDISPYASYLTSARYASA